MAGRLIWIGKSALISMAWAALGASLAIWLLGGAWSILLYVLAASALGAILGSLHRWNARERAYHADVAQEALHHLS